jgi:hypothetical protein
MKCRKKTETCGSAALEAPPGGGGEAGWGPIWGKKAEEDRLVPKGATGNL